MLQILKNIFGIYLQFTSDCNAYIELNEYWSVG